MAHTTTAATAGTTTISRQQITLCEKEQDLKGELDEVIQYQCAFCGKTVSMYAEPRRLCEKLSGGSFYCPFCIRHSLNTRNSRHFLGMSFRGIVGYYYHNKYLNTNHREMWLAEINDYIEAHVSVGLLNPTFNYDPETLLWFVDFSKVGRGMKKIRVKDVLKTVLNILVCFNLDEHVPGIRMSKLYEKYEEAIQKFYTERYRPEDKKMLIPTLQGCMSWDTNRTNYESTRQFMQQSGWIG